MAEKRIFEIISLSENTDPELVDYAFAKTRGQLQKFSKFGDSSFLPDKRTDTAELVLLFRESVTNFKLRRILW